MSAAGSHQCDTSLEKPSAVHVTVVETDENRGRVQSQLCVASDNPFERQRILMRQTLRHPGVSHGEAVGVKFALVCEGLDQWPIMEGIARFHLIFERVPFPFNDRQFSV